MNRYKVIFSFRDVDDKAYQIDVEAETFEVEVTDNNVNVGFKFLDNKKITVAYIPNDHVLCILRLSSGSDNK